MKESLCESCHQRQAKVFLGLCKETGSTPEHQLCDQCADDYYARTPGMSRYRCLIRLSDSYRTKLYDLLEAAHPEAFDDEDADTCRRASDLMRAFLRKNLKKDKVNVTGDAFDMLCIDFFCSHHYYSRVDEFKKREG